MPVRIFQEPQSASTNEIISHASNIEFHCAKLSPLVKNGSIGSLRVGKGFLEWEATESLTVHLEYTEITLHAIAREDAVVGGKPCIYLQLTNSVIMLNGSTYSPSADLADPNGNPVEEQDEDEEEDSLIEIRLAPQATTRGIVDDIFAAMCEASALHQDDMDEDDAPFEMVGDTAENNWITSENVDSFTPNADQQERLERLERLLQESQSSNTSNENGKRSAEGQFDDAPEDMQR